MLFHGPAARGEAIAFAREVGRPVSSPIGDDGLKVDDSRALVALAGSSGVGDRPPCVVVGPLDDATPEAADALLKTLEDLASGPLRIILWCESIGGVIGTIRSRTLPRWSPAPEGWVSPYKDAHAEKLVAAWAKDDLAGCLAVISDNRKDWSALLRGFCEVISTDHVEDPRTVKAWESVRPLLDGKGSYLNAAAVFIEVVG